MKLGTGQRNEGSSSKPDDNNAVALDHVVSTATNTSTRTSTLASRAAVLCLVLLVRVREPY